MRATIMFLLAFAITVLAMPQGPAYEITDGKQLPRSYINKLTSMLTAHHRSCAGSDGLPVLDVQRCDRGDLLCRGPASSSLNCCSGLQRSATSLLLLGHRQLRGSRHS